MALGAGVNTLPLKNVYPTLRGATIGAQGSAGAAPGVATAPASGEGASNAAAKQAAANPVAQALAVGEQANPLRGFIIFMVMLAALMFATHKLGGGNAATIKGSFFNVVLITLAAATGLPALKALLTHFKVPGVSNYVLGI